MRNNNRSQEAYKQIADGISGLEEETGCDVKTLVVERDGTTRVTLEKKFDYIDYAAFRKENK